MKEEFFYNGCMCPVCEVGTLSLVERDLEFEYKGEKVILTREVWECSECKESFFQAKDKPEIKRVLTDRRRRVDDLLVSEEIIRVREQLHMTIAELAKVLRIPEKNLAYYESGQYTQSYEMDDLLRILQEYPEAINVLKQERKKTKKKRSKRKNPKLKPIRAKEMTPQPIKA